MLNLSATLPTTQFCSLQLILLKTLPGSDRLFACCNEKMIVVVTLAIILQLFQIQRGLAIGYEAVYDWTMNIFCNRNHSDCFFLRHLPATRRVDCPDPGLNQGPLDLQSNALPTELSRPVCLWQCWKFVLASLYSLLGQRKRVGPAEIWTRIAGFRVQSANHYTTGPCWYLDFFFTWLFLVWHCTSSWLFVRQTEFFCMFQRTECSE